VALPDCNVTASAAAAYLSVSRRRLQALGDTVSCFTPFVPERAVVSNKSLDITSAVVYRFPPTIAATQ
jgi:hypothetical protein